MSLNKRLERIEQSPEAQRAARIAHAEKTDDLSGLTDDDLVFLCNGIEDELRLDGASDDDLRAIVAGKFELVKDDNLRQVIMRLANEGARRANTIHN